MKNTHLIILILILATTVILGGYKISENFRIMNPLLTARPTTRAPTAAPTARPTTRAPTAAPTAPRRTIAPRRTFAPRNFK